MTHSGDVPLFVEHCEAVAAEIDVKLRWLGEQARRGQSVWSGALPSIGTIPALRASGEASCFARWNYLACSATICHVAAH